MKVEKKSNIDLPAVTMVQLRLGVCRRSFSSMILAIFFSHDLLYPQSSIKPSKIPPYLGKATQVPEAMPRHVGCFHFPLGPRLTRTF